MKFKIGDRIELIDEALKGHIVSIKGKNIVMLTEEGFEMEVSSNEVVKTVESPGLDVTPLDISKALEEKGEHITKKKTEKAVHKPDALFMEVDLHIHELTDVTRGLGNYGMLSLQLATARKKLEYAMAKNIRKVVFIHGVGAGVLKAELEALFGRYRNISWYDADFKKYGFGATEVYIYQNY